MSSGSTKTFKKEDCLQKGQGRYTLTYFNAPLGQVKLQFELAFQYEIYEMQFFKSILADHVASVLFNLSQAKSSPLICASNNGKDVSYLMAQESRLNVH